VFAEDVVTTETAEVIQPTSRCSLVYVIDFKYHCFSTVSVQLLSWLHV